MLYYFLRNTFNNIREGWTTFTQATALIGAAFFILGAFSLASIQLFSVLKAWEQQAPIIAYLKDSLTEKEMEFFLRQVRNWPGVEKAVLFSSKKSFNILRNSLGEKAYLLDGVPAELIPPSVELYLHSKFYADKLVSTLRQRLLLRPEVQRVDLQKQWFSPLWTVSKWMKSSVFIGGIAVFLASILITAGAIRLDLYAHRKEIEIMRLLGATEGFIRTPFYLEGLFKGFLASTFAISFLALLFFFIERNYGTSYLQFTSVRLQFFSPLEVLFFIFAGSVTGIVGSWIALNSLPTEEE